MLGHLTFWSVLGLALLLVDLYYPVLLDLAAQWSIDTTFGYGYFVPPVVAYLIWTRRDQIRSVPLQSSWRGYVVLLVGLVALVMGRVGEIALLARVSLVIVLFGAVLFLGGRQITQLLAFPLALLLIMIPMPVNALSRLTWPLQVFTARFSTEVLQLAGYPVFLHGIYIDLPTVRLEVAAACSGFSSLVSLGITGVLLAYLTQDRWINRGLLVAAVAPIAIFANAIRVTSNIALGFYEGTFHLLSGWIVFAIATACLIGLAMLLSRRSKGESQRVGGDPP